MAFLTKEKESKSNGKNSRVDFVDEVGDLGEFMSIPTIQLGFVYNDMLVRMLCKSRKKNWNSRLSKKPLLQAT